MINHRPGDGIRLLTRGAGLRSLAKEGFDKESNLLGNSVKTITTPFLRYLRPAAKSQGQALNWNELRPKIDRINTEIPELVKGQSLLQMTPTGRHGTLDQLIPYDPLLNFQKGVHSNVGQTAGARLGPKTLITPRGQIVDLPDNAVPRSQHASFVTPTPTVAGGYAPNPGDIVATGRVAGLQPQAAVKVTRDGTEHTVPAWGSHGGFSRGNWPPTDQYSILPPNTSALMSYDNAMSQQTKDILKKYPELLGGKPARFNPAGYSESITNPELLYEAAVKPLNTGTTGVFRRLNTTNPVDASRTPLQKDLGPGWPRQPNGLFEEVDPTKLQLNPRVDKVVSELLAKHSIKDTPRTRAYLKDKIIQRIEAIAAQSPDIPTSRAPNAIYEVPRYKPTGFVEQPNPQADRQFLNWWQQTSDNAAR